ATLTRPEVAVAPIRRDLRALAKGISNEAEENNETDRCKNPIGHHLILRVVEVTVVQPYVSSASYFQLAATIIRGTFYISSLHLATGRSHRPRQRPDPRQQR